MRTLFAAVMAFFSAVAPQAAVYASGTEPIARFEASTVANATFSFSPDGKFFASIVLLDEKPFLEIRQTDTGAILTRSPQPVRNTLMPAWHHKGSGLYTTGTSTEELLHWDGASWEMSMIEGLSFGIWAGGQLSLSPDSTKLVAHNYRSDISVVLLDENGLKKINSSEGRGHFAAWSPDGRYLATGYAGVVIILDTINFQENRRYEGVSDGVYENAIINALKWSPSGRFLAIETLYLNAYLVEPANISVNLKDLESGLDFVLDPRWVPQEEPAWHNFWRSPRDILSYRGDIDVPEPNNEISFESYVFWLDPASDKIVGKASLGTKVFGEVNSSEQTLINRGTVILHSISRGSEGESRFEAIESADIGGEVKQRKLPPDVFQMIITSDGRFAALWQSGGVISLWRLEDLLGGD